MKRFKFILVILALLCAIFLVFLALQNEHSLLIHPKGLIAHKELHLIIKNTLLMLSIIVPTFILLLVTLYKSLSNKKKQSDTFPLCDRRKAGAFTRPRSQFLSHVRYKQWILWTLPACIVLVMAIITWNATHELDPYKPLQSDAKPIRIQVIALDWKWLFIYPEQEIATVNFVQFPEMTPVHFELSADGSPMNSFWIPQLSGQIYSMSGMITSLHIMADTSGLYTGRAAEINGEGFADMVFNAKATSPAAFEEWVTSVKQSPLHLNDFSYNALLQRSINHPVTLYSSVEEDLFHKIVLKYHSKH